MKNNILLLLLLVMLPSFAFSQKFKMVEQSGEKPEWIKNRPMGTYMIKADKAKTLALAELKAMESLRLQIASSVATSVTGETETTTDYATNQGHSTTMTSVIKTKVAKMPALQGISSSKASGIYWERYYDKKSKQEYYDYYILYQFTSRELQDLIDEYNKNEKAINDRIDNFKNILDELDDVDQLLNNIDEMKSMINEIGDDDESKCNRLRNYISLYEKAIDNIYIEVLENKNGQLVIQLKSDDKTMITSSMPKVKSECARDFSSKPDDDKIKIIFNTFDCYEQDDNYVEVRFTFGKKRLTKKVRINL